MTCPIVYALRIHASWSRLLCIALALLTVTTTVNAEDVVKQPLHDSAKGMPADYRITVIEEALKRTEKKYGSYRFADRVPIFARDRILAEMIRGEETNLSISATQPLWEEKLITIRIPIDMGLSSYRISLIHRDAQAKLSAVHTLEELQKLTIGVGSGWSSRQIFDTQGFQVVTGDTYDALLKMLISGRFDHFPRGLNEAIPEFDARRGDYPDLVIEKDLVIEFPLPTYVFISPNAPHLAKRLEEGMESMVRDGTLLKMVLKFNAETLDRVNLCARRVFHITNPLLSEKTPLARKELWFDPFNSKAGGCGPAPKVQPQSKPKPNTRPAKSTVKTTS